MLKETIVNNNSVKADQKNTFLQTKQVAKEKS